MDDNGFRGHEDFPHPLESFLIRSSPPLVSLSLSFAEGDEEAYDEDTYWLDQCMRLVGGTLECLEFFQIPNNSVPSIFDHLQPDSLPHIRTLRFKDLCGPLDLPTIIHILHRFDTLRTAAFVWTSSPFLDNMITVYASTPARCRDTVSGHLSRLAQKGMEIYLGTDEKNYLSNGDASMGQKILC
ncbi:hypothetical protein MSAN_01490800 [Mycena sanguinolenta]|uniref:Uncharacterized protein n=1 Tax=Mycena sanguinolenta TaxID=230812 RepID=A0A8H6YCC0_9AGAR|nr:hypothetical protein MSAN_01490800 [Mycena sanguinolenta]